MVDARERMEKCRKCCRKSCYASDYKETIGLNKRKTKDEWKIKYKKSQPFFFPLICKNVVNLECSIVVLYNLYLDGSMKKQEKKRKTTMAVHDNINNILNPLELSSFEGPILYCALHLINIMLVKCEFILSCRW